MGRQRAPVQVNEFIGGFNTEASPLNFPLNATLSELNVELMKDGSREQRGGMDVEASFNLLSTDLPLQTGLPLGRSQFRWVNPGGYGTRQFIVVQLGNYLAVHSMNETVLSTAPVFTKVYDQSTYTSVFSYDVVDGYLVIVTGLKEVTILQFDGLNISESTDILYVRDFFGVESTINGTVLTDPTNHQVRPTTLRKEHIYNLRNQTYALPRVTGNTNSLTLADPIELFHDVSPKNDYPSNADSINKHYRANTSLDSSRTVNRYHGTDHVRELPGSDEAPKGYFIIDLMDRGASRQSNLDTLYSTHSELNDFGALPMARDLTPGGPKAVAQYAGRMWYAGFSSEVIGGDNRSPGLASYVTFSRVVRFISEITMCYQAADPTSPDDPDLGDSDGGFIKVDGAYNIVALVPVASSLFVFAANGIWRISGLDSNTFSATSYAVEKISELGCSYAKSVVEFNSNVFYWGDEGIYRLGQDPASGDWKVEDIVVNSIKSFYEDIPYKEKRNVSGYYDFRTTSVRWLYGNDLEDVNSYAKELILNVNYKAFTLNSLPRYSQTLGPVGICGGQSLSSDPFVEVTSGGTVVTAGGVNVTISNPLADYSPSESLYCIVTGVSPYIEYSFGGYKTDDWYDWSRLTSNPNFPNAYLVFGWMSSSEGRLRKDTPYLTVHFPNMQDTGSCMLSAQWDWTNDPQSYKWSDARESYRYHPREQWHEVISTRNLIRGSGRAVSFRFQNANESPLKVKGWEFNLTATQSE